MAKRINEDIRKFQATDPYYYEVDNLPLEDLEENDKRLQNQLDELAGNDRIKIDRSGFNDLAPYIDPANPGRLFVKAGNFIGRTQRAPMNSISTGDVARSNGGLLEQNTDPAEDFAGERANVTNPGTNQPEAAKWVGRTALFQFLGGSISLDPFNRGEFQTNDRTGSLVSTPPRGRIDLIGLTTVEGAFDDSSFLPSNYTDTDMSVADGQPRLAVVRGAGMLYGNPNTDFREIVVGEKYFTIGTPAEMLNDYGRKFSDGTEEADPAFGTVPSPDDIVNLCIHRPDIQTSLLDFAKANKNESFFLPIAYVFVPDSYNSGEAISEDYIKDIRPFFRTAELSHSERQAIAASISPSVTNPFVTTNHLSSEFQSEVNRDSNKAAVQQQINSLLNRLIDLESRADVVAYTRFGRTESVRGLSTASTTVSLIPSKYLIFVSWQIGIDSSSDINILFKLVRKDTKAVIATSRAVGGGPNNGTNINKDDDGFGTYIIEAEGLIGENKAVECYVEMEVESRGGLALDSRDYLLKLNDCFAMRSA